MVVRESYKVQTERHFADKQLSLSDWRFSIFPNEQITTSRWEWNTSKTPAVSAAWSFFSLHSKKRLFFYKYKNNRYFIVHAFCHQVTSSVDVGCRGRR